MKKFLTAFLVLIAGTAYAQINTENANLEERVGILEQKLKDKSAALDKISRYIQPSGYVIGGYEWNDANTSTFKINNVNISLAGNLYKGDYGTLDYKILIGFAGTPKVMDVFATYMPIKEFGVKAGQFKSPLTYENSMRSPTTLEFVNYSLAIQRLARMSDRDVTGLSVSGRDIGIELLGSALHRDGFSILSYELALLNGYKLNTTDNNKSKDIAARLMVNPLKELTFTGSFQRGEGAYPIFDDLTQSYTPQDANKYVKMYRYAGGVDYKGRGGFARAEMVGGKTDELKSLGGYLAGGVSFAKDWMLVGRLDYFDENVDSGKVYEMDYTGGISYSPLNCMNLKLNYTYKQLKGGFQDCNCIYLQMTVKF